MIEKLNKKGTYLFILIFLCMSDSEKNILNTLCLNDIILLVNDFI